MSVIHQIKSTISLVDVLERYVGEGFHNIRTNRSRFNIRCPFHNDRNPSFTVYSDTNTFRCWSGCNNGKPGDVIDVVKLLRNVDTKEAIKVLISDYGLEQPDSAQAKEWQKKRAYQEQSAALKKAINKKVFEAMDALKAVEQSAKNILTAIRTVEDLDRVGDLYHVVVQIDYWFDCLIDNKGIGGQLQTLQEISSFVQNMKEGKGA